MDNDNNKKNQPINAPQNQSAKNWVIIAAFAAIIVALILWYYFSSISQPEQSEELPEQSEALPERDYGISIETIGEIPVVYTGSSDAGLADFRLIEKAVGSLLDNGSLTVELPDYVYWFNDGPVVTQEKGATAQIDMEARTNGNNGTVDNSRHTIEYNVAQTTGSVPGVIIFENNRVYVDIDAPEGDIIAVISGTGVREDISVILGVAAKPVTVTGGGAEVVIGRQGQKAADLVIAEAEKGMFHGNPTIIDMDTTDKSGAVSVSGNDGEIFVTCPRGVTWVNTPAIRVDGDLRLVSGSVRVNTIGNRSTLRIRVANSSTKPSVITISDIVLTLDRTVPEGPLKLEVSGNAIDRAGGGNNKVVAAAAVANVITSTPVSTAKKISVFTIGSAGYTVNDAVNTMDIPPYLKDGNPYISLGYLAQALDITDQNIIWNDSDQTVTLMKGGTVVQLKIGSTQALINGVTVGMDAAPEIADDQKMLPAVWVAHAFGYDALWDATAQQITISSNN